MSAIFAQKLIGALASSDVTWRHVHETLKVSSQGTGTSNPGV